MRSLHVPESWLDEGGSVVIFRHSPIADFSNEDRKGPVDGSTYAAPVIRRFQPQINGLALLLYRPSSLASVQDWSPAIFVAIAATITISIAIAAVIAITIAAGDAAL